MASRKSETLLLGKNVGRTANLDRKEVADEMEKKLTKAELKHIRETTNGFTLASFKRNIAKHREEEAKDGTCPCFDCRIIARKLGV